MVAVILIGRSPVVSENSIARDSLVHYNNQHIQVRKDFFDLCAYDKNDFNQGLTRSGKKVKDEPNQECMAKILRLLETLTNHRKHQWYIDTERYKAKGIRPPAEPDEYRIELAYSTIVSLLYETYGESTVRNSVAVLLQRDYIKRYQDTKNSVPSYVLNVKVLQSALDRQAMVSSLEQVSKSTPDENEVSKSTAQVSISTPQVSKSTAQLSKSTPNKKDHKKAFHTPFKKELSPSSLRNFSSGQPRSSYDDPNYEDDSFYPTREVK